MQPPRDDELAAFIGQRIFEARMLQGLTQMELARRMATSSSILSHFEHGHHCPGLSTLLKIARALSLPITYFLPEGPMTTRKEAVIDPGGNGALVDELWVAIVRHGPDSEAVPAGIGRGPNGERIVFTLMTSNQAGLDDLRVAIRRCATAGSKPIRLVRFEAKETLETYYPDGSRREGQ